MTDNQAIEKALSMVRFVLPDIAVYDEQRGVEKGISLQDKIRHELRSVVQHSDPILMLSRIQTEGFADWQVFERWRGLVATLVIGILFTDGEK